VNGATFGDRVGSRHCWRVRVRRGERGNSRLRGQEGKICGVCMVSRWNELLDWRGRVSKFRLLRIQERNQNFRCFEPREWIRSQV
jgi:hypothetical protein